MPDAADPTGYTALHAMIAARRVPPGDLNPPPDPTGDMTSLEFVAKLAAHGANLERQNHEGAPHVPGGTCKASARDDPVLDGCPNRRCRVNEDDGDLGPIRCLRTKTTARL